MYWKTKPQIHSSVEPLRKAKKLTQAQLALSAGVTRQTIIAIEKGNYIPSVALAIKLAQLLGSSVEQTFKLEEEAC